MISARAVSRIVTRCDDTWIADFKSQISELHKRKFISENQLENQLIKEN